MQNKIYLVDIESIPNRYSCEWKTEFPYFLETNLPEFKIVLIEGRKEVPEAVTPGAFINFGGTNIYKSDQIARLSELFTLDEINDGDHIIFADAWHPGIINIKYMASLLNKNIILHGLWHAGSYDKWDFLGRLIGNEPWINSAEKSFFHCYDYNWFATSFHINMFSLGVFKDTNEKNQPYHRTGWPMHYTKSMLANNYAKKNIIIYPHRLAPEKRIDLFKNMKQDSRLSNFEFIIPMELNLTKSEYHELLKKSKYVVSFAEQETLGISIYEGLCAGAIPIVPDRLSYSEMYSNIFKFKIHHDDKVMVQNAIESILSFEKIVHNEPFEFLKIKSCIDNEINRISKRYFEATELVNSIKQSYV